MESELTSDSNNVTQRKHFSTISVVLCIIGLGLVASTASASIGTTLFDKSFSSDGRITTDFGGNDSGNSMVLQPDGKIIVTGNTSDGKDIALARYNSDGTLDDTFDSDGKVTTDFGGSDSGASILLQQNGKIIVAGERYKDRKFDFILARYNSDGTLDDSFDSDGKITTDFGGDDSGASVALQLDGKIIVAGMSDANGTNDIALARYTTDGLLDESFDSDGKITTNFGGFDAGRAVIVQPDGNIVVAGYISSEKDYDFALVRYTTGGLLDESFDSDGKVTTDFGSYDGGQSMALQSNGKIVVAGNSSYNGSENFAVARYNTDGNLDVSFGVDGKVTTDFGSYENSNSVVLQSDGKIIVAGYSDVFADYDFALSRYNTDGTLDDEFDSDGKTTVDLGGDDIVYSVLVQPSGKILMAGSSHGTGGMDFALARFDIPPTVTLAVPSATSASQTITFTVSGDSAIDCMSLSSTIDEDFTFSNISAIIGITQTSSAVCTITATSTAIANDVSVRSALGKATSFSITGANGFAQTSLLNTPQSVTVTIANSTPTTSVPPATTLVAPETIIAKADTLPFAGGDSSTPALIGLLFIVCGLALIIRRKLAQ